MSAIKVCQSASGSSRALYSVFVAPALSTSSRTIPRHALSRSLSVAVTSGSKVSTSRSFSSTSLLSAAPRVAEKRSQKWDNEITARMIQLVDPETNKLEEPRTRFDVMLSYDPKTHRLVQVSADEPGNRHFIPVCKIVDKKDAYNADRKRKEQQKEQKSVRAKENSIKTLELNWAIDANDLGHRLDRIKEFLEEGRKVEIVVAAKKRGRKASMQECKEMMGKIKGVVGEVTGAKELKAFEGKFGGFGTMMLQGKQAAGGGATKNDNTVSQPPTAIAA